MGLTDFFKLEKLRIEAYSDIKRQSPAGKFDAMFNPESVSQTYRTVYVKPEGPNDGKQAATFLRSAPNTLDLKLLLDGTHVDLMGVERLFGTTSVADRVKEFLDAAYHVQGDTHEPNYLKVIWGGLFSESFDCRLVSVTINYTSFNRDGSPLRAELDIKLAADADLEKQASKLGLNSPDLTHSRVVCGGDTLPLLTAKIYGDARHFVRVGRVNGLDQLRDVRLGQSLVFPPLAK